MAGPNLTAGMARDLGKRVTIPGQKMGEQGDMPVMPRAIRLVQVLSYRVRSTLARTAAIRALAVSKAIWVERGFRVSS